MFTAAGPRRQSQVTVAGASAGAVRASQCQCLRQRAGGQEAAARRRRGSAEFEYGTAADQGDKGDSNAHQLLRVVMLQSVRIQERVQQGQIQQ